MSWPFLIAPLAAVGVSVVVKLAALARVRARGDQLSMRACEVARAVLDQGGEPRTAVVRMAPEVYESRGCWEAARAALDAGFLLEQARFPVARLLRGVGRPLAWLLLSLAVFLAAAGSVVKPAEPFFRASVILLNVWMDVAIVWVVFRWRAQERACALLSQTLSAGEGVRLREAMRAHVFDVMGGWVIECLEVFWRRVRNKK